MWEFGFGNVSKTSIGGGRVDGVGCIDMGKAKMRLETGI